MRWPHSKALAYQARKNNNPVTNPLASFLLTLTFFTRLPLPERLSNKITRDHQLGDAMAMFPVVGLLIGCALAFVWTILIQLTPSPIAAGLVIATGLILTGALHEDGFADCADGLGGSSNREKALEIMRDSRIGTYGGAALIFSIGLRWAALASLSPAGGFAALIIAHCASRSAITIAMQYANYARTEGLGKLAEHSGNPANFYISIAVTAICAILLGGFVGMIIAALALFVCWGFLQYLKHRLGGYTGDGLGAIQQVGEISILIGLASFWT
jgi:adenosylcobinamide-GDP ribazoletransferase